MMSGLIGYKFATHIHETEAFRFVAEGHKYFVDSKPFDLSVTGFVGTFSEDSVRVQGV